MTTTDLPSSTKKQSSLLSFFKPGVQAPKIVKDESERPLPKMTEAEIKGEPSSAPLLHARTKPIAKRKGTPSPVASAASPSESSSSGSSSGSSDSSSCSSSESETEGGRSVSKKVRKLSVASEVTSTVADTADICLDYMYSETLTPLDEKVQKSRNKFVSFSNDSSSNQSPTTSYSECLSVEEIEKMCVGVPPFINTFIHLYYEYCNRFDFPSWYDPKKLKDKNNKRPYDADYDCTSLSVPRRNGKVVEEGHATPMLQQYWDIKEVHFSDVVLFKVGKFYEMFYMDAAIGQRVCGLKWMGHDRRAHVGFPEVSLEHHATLLIDQGYTVCVVEQTETVNEANERTGRKSGGGALVERKICEVFTTGTVVKEKMIGAKPDAHYVCHVVEASDSRESGKSIPQFSVVVGDCSTGEFFLHSDVIGGGHLRTVLYTYLPREILFDVRDAQVLKILNAVRDSTGCVVSRWTRYQIPVGSLAEIVHDSEIIERANRNEWVKKSICGIVSYLDHLLLTSQVTLCSKWTLVSGGGGESGRSISAGPFLDSNALVQLEILRDSEGTTRGSLVKFVDRCATAFGSRLLRKWLCTPLRDVTEIQERQLSVEWLVGKGASYLKRVTEKLASFPDLERRLQSVCAQALQQARGAVFFSEVENQRLAKFLGFLDAVKEGSLFLESFGKEEAELGLLRSLSEGVAAEVISFCDELKSKVARSSSGCGSNGSPSYSPQPGADPEYDAEVANMKSVEERLNAELRDIREALGTSNAIFLSVKFRYEIEISAELESKLKKRDIEYEVTSCRKGYVRFQTENIRKLVELLEQSEQRQKDLMYPFMSKLFSGVNQNRMMFSGLIGRIAQVDCLVSFAKIAVSNGKWTKPVFGHDEQKSSTIRLLQARHPIQEFLMSTSTTPTQFVPNDIVLDRNSKTLLVTGANMGGKSTILRQICLNVILAQIGSFVPCDECFISRPVDRVFTRIGASDNILEGKSTFLTELEETAVILNEATENSLCVIDELGRGTSTYDGVAIAGATLQYIATSVHCFCLFATHYHQLADDYSDADSKSTVKVFHMELLINEQTGKILLTHKFKPGLYPHSQAMHVAELAGLPQSVLSEADQISREFAQRLTKR